MPSISTAEAIRLAREWLERYLPDEPWPGPESELLVKARLLGIIEPDGMGHLLRDPKGGFISVRGRSLDMDKLDDLAKAAARGDKEADRQVIAIAIWVVKRSNLPKVIHDLVVSLLLAKLPKRRGDLGRDIEICLVIYRLQEYGFSPTRNREHGPNAPESGCSIVSKALAEMGIHLSERAIEKVWEKYSHMR